LHYMPTLNKYVDKDGYYIKGYIPGLGQNSTLQVTQTALRRIQDAIGSEEGHFAPSLLRQLLAENLVYTKGLSPLSGLPINIPSISVTRLAPQAARRSAVKLVFVETELTWGLALRVAEIPQAWAAAVDSLVDALANWRLCAVGATPVPATRLWPGKGGALIAVAPQQKSYGVIADGYWPDTWDVRAWLGQVPGLGSRAMLFSTDNGVRIEPSTALILGESYVLVAPADLATGRGRWPPPQILMPESLGELGAWHAWAIQLPRSSSEQLRSWCEAIGYRLTLPRFRLSLITPPQGYSDMGLPIVTKDEEIVLVLEPANVDSGAEISTTFYTTRFSEPGSFKITIDEASIGEGSVAPLYLVVEQCSTEARIDYPAALTIKFNWSEHQISLQALRDSVGPHLLQIPCSTLNDDIEIQLSCPVPLHLIWKAGELGTRRDGIVAEEAAALISEQLREGARHRAQLNLQIDAGPYGRLCLEFATAVEKQTISPLGPTTERRTRWLAAVLRHPRSHATIRLASPPIRRLLERLAQVPGCAALSHVQAVPTDIVPHLYALIKSVQDRDHR
jgi:hypothetical protein